MRRNWLSFGIMSRLQSFHFHVPQRKKKEGINYDKRKNRIAFTLNLYLVLISKSYTTNLNIALTLNQGCQYRTGGRTGLATGTIYFGYRSIPEYRFGFTAILYIYIYIYIYVCVSVYIYYNKYKSLQ